MTDQSPEAEVLKKLIRLKIDGVSTSTKIRELNSQKIVSVLYRLTEKWDIQCCKPNCKKTKEKFACVKTALRMMDYSHMTPTIRQIKSVKKERKSFKFIVRVLENMIDKLEQRYSDLYTKRDWPKHPHQIDTPKSPKLPRKQSAYTLPDDLDSNAIPQSSSLPSNNTSFKISASSIVFKPTATNSKSIPTHSAFSETMQVEGSESKESSEKDLPISAQISFTKSSTFQKPFDKVRNEAGAMNIDSPIKTVDKKDPSRFTPSPGLFFKNTSPVISLPAGFKSTLPSLTSNTHPVKKNTHPSFPTSTQSISNPVHKPQLNLHKTTQELKRFSLDDLKKESIFVKKKEFEHSVGEKRPREEDVFAKRKRIQLIHRTSEGTKSSSNKSNLFQTLASQEKNVNPDFAEALNNLSNSDFTSQTIELSGIDRKLLRSKFGGQIRRIFCLIFARLQDYDVQDVSTQDRLLWKIQKPIPQERWMNVLATVRSGIAKIRECMPSALNIETKMMVWSSEKNIRINDSQF